MRNNHWAGYYEDVKADSLNLNQQIPMETARYILQHSEMDPDYKTHVPALIEWVKNHFGKNRHFGAASICEQDSFYVQMSSHTARYASVVAMWYGISHDPMDREEARAAFALATYSAYNKFSKDGRAINYVGIEYAQPWFSDSYWDYISHFFDGMAELPEMLPPDENHLFYSTSVIRDVTYAKDEIAYEAFDSHGRERLKLNFEPIVYADGEPMPQSQWRFGDYHGVPGVLQIERKKTRRIVIKELVESKE